MVGFPVGVPGSFWEDEEALQQWLRDNFQQFELVTGRNLADPATHHGYPGTPIRIYKGAYSPYKHN